MMDTSAPWFWPKLILAGALGGVLWVVFSRSALWLLHRGRDSIRRRLMARDERLAKERMREFSEGAKRLVQRRKKVPDA